MFHKHITDFKNRTKNRICNKNDACKKIIFYLNVGIHKHYVFSINCKNRNCILIIIKSSNKNIGKKIVYICKKYIFIVLRYDTSRNLATLDTHTHTHTPVQDTYDILYFNNVVFGERKKRISVVL